MFAPTLTARTTSRRPIRAIVAIGLGALLAVAIGMPASASNPANGANGTTDPNFATALGTGFDGDVLTSAQEPGGDLLVGGGFTHLNGTAAPGLVRLHHDGTVDTAFEANLGGGFELGSVRSIAVQSTGKIVVGGLFTQYASLATAGLVRLNADGTLDTAFRSAIGAGVHGYLETVLVQPDDKILIGGGFSSFDTDQPGNLARLNADGSADTTFIANEGTGFSNQVNSLALQSDGSVIVGGQFIQLNGQPDYFVGRLDSTGHPDTAFDSHFAYGDGNVNSVLVQPDGRILIGGDFAVLGGANVSFLGRVNSDGSRDLNFDVGTEFDDAIYSLALQSNGYILVGGEYTANDPTGSRFTRLDTVGAVDAAFTNELAPNFDDAVWTIQVEPAGTILVGGAFNPGRLARIGFTPTPPKPVLATTGSADEGVLGLVGGSLLAVGAFALLIARRTVRSSRVRSPRI